MQQIAENLWEAETPIRFGFIPLRHRMTVIRLRDGRLVLHSPAKLTDGVVQDLNGRGEVAAVIAPSWWHDLWLKQWRNAYPSVPIYAAPALIKPGSIEMIPLDGTTTPWNGELEQTHVRGLGLWLDEYAFFHPASRSLIVADLLLSPSESDPPLTRWFSNIFVGRVPGCVFPRLYRPAITNREAFRDSVSHISAWDFDRIIPGHGAIVESNGKAVFLAAFSRMLY